MAKRRWSGKAKRFVKRYNAYKRSFEARVNKMIEQGLTPYDAIPLKYTAWHRKCPQYGRWLAVMFIERSFELIGEFIARMLTEMAVVLVVFGIIISVILARVEQ